MTNLQTDRKTMGQFFTVLAVLLIGIMALPLSDEAAAADLSVRPPESLQQVWNDLMLAGRFGRVDNGQVTKVESDNSLSDPSTSLPDAGWVFQAPMTQWGIAVYDLRERRFLMSQGGWVLKGGLLRRINIGDVRIELYGKTIQRHEPYLLLFPHWYFNDESWPFGHEFFLLLRSKGHDQALILRKWVVADSYDGYGGGLGGSGPRGFLEYDQFSRKVTVKVMDGHYAGLFIERVDVTDALAK
jgi:hypothetical protein